MWIRRSYCTVLFKQTIPPSVIHRKCMLNLRITWDLGLFQVDKTGHKSQALSGRCWRCSQSKHYCYVCRHAKGDNAASFTRREDMHLYATSGGLSWNICTAKYRIKQWDKTSSYIYTLAWSYFWKKCGGFGRSFHRSNMFRIHARYTPDLVLCPQL